MVEKLKSQNGKAYLQLALMMILTIITQAVMLIKTSVVASQFGVSAEMDAFNFTNNIGTFVFSFIGAGVTTVLIPNLVKEDKEKEINNFISILYSIAFIVLIGIYIFRKSLIVILSNGSEQFILIASNIMLITLLNQFITSFLGITNAIFQCNQKFNISKTVNLVISIVLVGLIIGTPNLDIYKYASCLLITTIINIVIQFRIAIKNGFKFKYNISFKSPELRAMMRIFAPTVLSVGLYQLSLIIDSILSSNLGEGQISILSYSNNIITLINSVLLVNIITYLYPKIAKNIDKEDSQENLFDLSILLNAIMMLIVLGYFIVGKEGITLLYERGKFTGDLTSIVYSCTLIYIIGLPTNAVRDLIYRYFYAKNDTLTPFKNSLLISALNIGISIVLSRFIGIYGIILGTVITSYMSLSLIFINFKRKFTLTYKLKTLIIENMKIIVASVISIVVVGVMKNYFQFNNIIVDLFVFGIIVVALYGVLLKVFKTKVFKKKL